MNFDNFSFAILSEIISSLQPSLCHKSIRFQIKEGNRTGICWILYIMLVVTEDTRDQSEFGDSWV